MGEVRNLNGKEDGSSPQTPTTSRKHNTYVTIESRGAKIHYNEFTAIYCNRTISLAMGITQSFSPQAPDSLPLAANGAGLLLDSSCLHPWWL